MQDKVLGTPVPSELTELAKADKARVTKGAESKQIIILDKKHVRCFEGWTGRYFLADKDSLDKAVNMVNARIIKETPGYCSLSTFYDYMDLEHTQMSDYYGWNFDKMLELQFYTVMSYDDEPCLAFDYKYDPTKL